MFGQPKKRSNYKGYADLSPRQQAFVREYLVDRDAKAAAIRAGYSPDTVDSSAYRLLSDPIIQAAISERERLIARKADVRVERLVAELARLALSDMGDFVELRAVRDAETGQERYEAKLKPWDGRVDTAAVQEIAIKPSGEVKLKLYNKTEAIETLGRMIGAFRGDTGGSRELIVRFADPDEQEADDRRQEPQPQLYPPMPYDTDDAVEDAEIVGDDDAGGVWIDDSDADGDDE